MKYKIILIIGWIVSIQNSLAQSNLQTDTMYVRCTQTLNFAFDQANTLLKTLSGTQLPNCINTSGSLMQVSAADWTSGFFQENCGTCGIIGTMQPCKPTPRNILNCYNHSNIPRILMIWVL